VQIIDCALSVGCGLVVVLQNGKPSRDVGGMILTDLRGEFEVGAKKRGTEFGDEFLAGIAFVGPAFPAEVALEVSVNAEERRGGMAVLQRSKNEPSSCRAAVSRACRVATAPLLKCRCDVGRPTDWTRIVRYKLWRAKSWHQRPFIAFQHYPAPDGTDLSDELTAPSIDSVLGKLGMRLERAKGPREFLVIDHVEKPSEN
jgi:hypothetical protein